MRMPAKILLAFLMLLVCSGASAGAVKKKDKTVKASEETTRNVLTVLWRQPNDISTRNLYFGPGGKQDQPRGPFTFIKEDLDGSNPKFTVRDRDGVKWKVKLGAEARPETVATRLVWAVGYSANEDYFLAALRVNGMPAHLQRKHADKFIEPDRSMRNVRLKREPEDEKKAGNWSWRIDPFSGTRELNGLRVMMALINNWDLKDLNNGIYDEKRRGLPDERIYMVSDLGGSFGTAWLDRTRTKSKGNLYWYSRTRFIKKIHENSVDFEDPRRPAFVVLVNPHEFFSRLGLRWIGRNVPRTDAKWMGGLLAELSDAQIRDAFRAAGYSPQEVAGFSSVVESRIAELNRL
ncbi:MAG TPA: hypothetical protein VEV17_27025 [Bryobacteraceae bacterium]|nr:hypothetical protein [Bryobacteraceae bacterium]